MAASLIDCTADTVGDAPRDFPSIRVTPLHFHPLCIALCTFYFLIGSPRDLGYVPELQTQNTRKSLQNSQRHHTIERHQNEFTAGRRHPHPASRAYAQEKRYWTGTVTDSPARSCPGATVRAVRQPSGNNFQAVSNKRAGCIGFPSASASIQQSRRSFKVLPSNSRAGGRTGSRQSGVVNSVSVEPSQLQSPIIGDGHGPNPPGSITKSVQIQAAQSRSGARCRSSPVNGRTWMALALLAPGSGTSSTRTPITPLPDRNGGEAREFQLNIDGQQVSADIGTGGQPS